MIRPGPGGCTIRLQIDEIDAADSLQEAEDIWLPVLEALRQLVNPGSLPEAGAKARSGYGGCVPLPPSCGGWVPQPPITRLAVAVTVARNR